MDLQDLQEKNRELSILNAIAQALNKGSALEEALDVTLQLVVQRFDLKTGWIWLFETENDSAQLKSTYNLPPAFLENPQLLAGTCYCIEKYLRGNLENAANISEITCSRLQDLKKGTDGLRYHACVPLSSADRKLGLMNVVSSNSQELSQADLQLLYTIGDLLSIAIERTRLFERSKQIGRIEERNRLAREIHDTLAQGLSAISLKLETVGLLYDQQNNHPKIKPTITQALKLTKNNLEDARRSVLDLRAHPLAENELEAAIQQLLIQSGLAYTLDFSPKPLRLPLRMEMGIYRIVQEVIQNIIKHAHAQTINLYLSIKASSIHLHVEDDGMGFDPANQGEGFGLIGINERVNLLKGQWTIQSHPDTGTRIDFKLPMT